MYRKNTGCPQTIDSAAERHKIRGTVRESSDDGVGYSNSLTLYRDFTSLMDYSLTHYISGRGPVPVFRLASSKTNATTVTLKLNTDYSQISEYNMFQ
jgi:hypothetical protein